MIRLVYSNRTEELLDALADGLRARRRAGAHPLDPVDLLVPNRNLEQHVRLGLAERLGVAANLRFRRLERFLAELVRAGAPMARLVDAEALRGGLLALFHAEAELGSPDLAPVRDYLVAPDAEGRALRRVQLASRLGRLFEEYAYSRPEMLAAWPAGPTLVGEHLEPLERWQRALWLALLGPAGWLRRHPPEGGAWVTLAGLLESGLQLPSGGSPLHIFGVSYVARAFQQLFDRLGASREVCLFTLNPCQEFWEDVESERELRQRLQRQLGPSPPPDEDPYELFSGSENLPLRLWGRPGREHVRLLDELTDCDFQARFAPAAEGETATLLQALQDDILQREPTAARPPRARWAADGSVRVLACPDPRREVEAVADAIWRLVIESEREGASPLRWSDVAVIVNAATADRYLPQVQAVFAEFHAIPCSVGDLPFAGERRVAEAARLLLALPFGHFTRAEMLRVMLHPAVRGRFSDLDPARWSALAAELGIFRGASHEDLADSYVGEDLLSWDQGLRRLALGTFLTGARSGDERLWQTGDGGEVLVAEQPASRLEEAGRFALLARSLLADARRLRGEQRSLRDWAGVLRDLIAAYLCPAEDEETDLRRCLGAIGALERADVGAVAVPGRVACELASAAIGGLSVAGGAPLGEGVVVSTLLPMRAIPFRAVFVLGLGEGEFPAANRRDALDLRAATRRPGDVTPAERDRYLFLETLLSARERLVLSYVSRDERTGEALRPSSVVQELLDLLDRGYVGAEGIRQLEVRVPARRWDPAYFPQFAADGEAAGPALPTVAPGAAAEAAARRLGETLREAVPRTVAAPLPVLRAALAPATWRDVATFLGLPEVPPAPSGSARDAPAAITAATLRRFLECPLQTSAATLLGLARDDREDASEVEQEALHSSRRSESILLADALVRALRRGEEPRAAYAALARPRELAGELPTGVLGELERELHGDLLSRWHQSLGRLTSRGRGERLRLGPVAEREDVDLILPALTLLGADGAPLVNVTGRTELLLDERRVSVLCDAGGSADPKEQEIRQRRLSLRGFFDHLLLAATGTLAGVERELVLLRRDGEGVSIALRAVRRETALAYLAALAADLLAGVHDYLLPCEAIFHAESSRRGALDLALIASEARRRIADGRAPCSSRWGPVPDPASYPVPAPERLRLLLPRRYGLFFSTLGTPLRRDLWSAA